MATTKWDAFISHATEDKAEFVEPLAKALSSLGVRVWYDKFAVKLGDSLSRSIDKGLSGSRFGIVVLSPAFLAKRWPEYELSGLVAREIAGRRVIIPIWHQLTKQQVLKFSPTLADKLAIRSDELPMEELAVRLVDELRPDLATRIHRRLSMLEQLMHPKIERVKRSSLKIGPIRHKELPADVLGRIRLIRAALLPFHPHTFKYWVDGFQRDAHPTREVEIWERVAYTALEYRLVAPRLSSDQQEAFKQVLFGLLCGRPFEELKVVGKDLPERGAATIAATFLSKKPLYEPRVKETFARVPNQDPPGVDKERFPRDLPDDLLKKVVRDRQGRKVSLVKGSRKGRRPTNAPSYAVLNATVGRRRPPAR